MFYYTCDNHILASETPLAFDPLPALPETGEIFWLFQREPLSGRETFAVSDGGLFTAAEDVSALCRGADIPDIPEELRVAAAAGRVRAVNAAHPRWRELLTDTFPAVLPAGKKYRVNLLALGDVGSTLAMGLRLMGGDVIASLGLCDVRPNVPERWEFELNQIGIPGEPDALPPVSVVDLDHLFDCDVFLFCASRFVPDTDVKTGDVRMAQYEKNRELAALYGKMAREKQFRGLFCVVSDPVDPLCRAVLLASNQNEAGEMDCQGLFPHQVKGFGLGVMNARAVYYARRDARFADFLTDGRTFGPHGEDLVVANSLSRYDDALSRELTELTTHANLEMRALGYKPYVAPALSSGALSLLLLLRGAWHCSSVYLGGVFMGCRNRLGQNGPEIERLPLPEALLQRLRETEAKLKAIL